MARITFESEARSWLDACDEVLNTYWIYIPRPSKWLSKIVKVVDISERDGGGYLITAEIPDEYASSIPFQE